MLIRRGILQNLKNDDDQEVMDWVLSQFTFILLIYDLFQENSREKEREVGSSVYGT